MIRFVLGVIVGIGVGFLFPDFTQHAGNFVSEKAGVAADIAVNKIEDNTDLTLTDRLPRE